MKSISKKIANYKNRATILVNDVKDVKTSTGETAKSAFSMLKETTKLPWSKLPLQGWLYIIFSAISLILMMIFI